LNINDGCGATAPDALAQAVRANRADLGIALDGDADRLQVVDGQGRLYNGDELLYVLVRDRLAMGCKVAGVVGTVMTNLAVEQALQALGVDFARAAVGDRYVLEQLRERGWQLGAESSGHIISLDRHTTGDGIVSALLVLAALKRSGQSIAQLLDGISLFPQKLINVRMDSASVWQNNATIRTAVAQAENDLAQTGRVLIRASGTEPVLRIMVEAQSAQLAEQYAESIAYTVRGATA
jgi:phosphoglucosamine mutase